METLDYAAVVANLKKPGSALLKQWDSTKASMVHMLTGIYDEFLELNIAFINKDPDNIKEEIGDFVFYCEGLLQDMGLTTEELQKGIEGIVEIDVSQFTHQVTSALTPFKRHLMYNNPLEREHAKGIIQIMAIAFALAKSHLGLSAEEILSANVNKLTKGRYKDGYSDSAANNRTDKA